MNGSNGDEERGKNETLLAYRLRQLENRMDRVIENDLRHIRKDIETEKNWRFLVTGGVGVASAFITWVITTWGARIPHP